MAFNVWGAAYPGNSIIFRFFIIHVLLFPLVIFGLLTAHLMILWRQKHTDFRGQGKPSSISRAAAYGPSTPLSRGALCRCRGP